MEADVVIVGYGAAGAAAALEASNNASVLILEKTPRPGGNAIVSGGKVYGTCSTFQKGNGVEDSPSKLYEYLTAVGGGLADPALTGIISKSSGKVIDWLQSLGVEWTGLETSGFEFAPGFNVPRTHNVEARGPGLWKRLQEAVEGRGVEVWHTADVKRLVMSQSGEVVGVEAKLNGEIIQVEARRAVVLATGGFTFGGSLLREVFPFSDKTVPLSVPACTGDGIRWAEEIGAEVVRTPGVVAHPAVAELRGPPAFLTVTRRRLPSVFVNEKGRRFVNEELHYDYTSEKIMEQGRVYAVFDERARRAGRKVAAGFSAELENEIASGLVVEADSIEPLARKLQIDLGNLRSSIADYNRYAERGKDLEFGRRSGLSSLETPYYAVQVTAGIIETKAGVRITEKTQVVNRSGAIIPRLFAAGRVAGGTMGEMYPGSGFSLLDAFCFGRISGEQSAR